MKTKTESDKDRCNCSMNYFRLWKSWSLFEETRLRFDCSSNRRNDEYNRQFGTTHKSIFIGFDNDSTHKKCLGTSESWCSCDRSFNGPIECWSYYSCTLSTWKNGQRNENRMFSFRNTSRNSSSWLLNWIEFVLIVFRFSYRYFRTLLLIIWMPDGNRNVMEQHIRLSFLIKRLFVKTVNVSLLQLPMINFSKNFVQFVDFCKNWRSLNWMFDVFLYYSRQIIDMPELVTNNLFKTNQLRVKNREELLKILSEKFVRSFI